MNRRDLSVCAIVSGFEPNDSESRLLLGSAWVHRVLVSICLGMGSSFWQSCHSLRMESQMHHATTICTTILGDAPRFSKNAPRKWEMHQAFSEMHQGKRENATGLSHSIKIGVLSQNSGYPFWGCRYFYYPWVESRTPIILRSKIF